MSTEVTKVEALKERAEQIQSVGDKWRGSLATVASQAARSVEMALAIAELTQLITPDMVSAIMPLMNSPLGFRTDKDPATAKPGTTVTPYSAEVVKRCWIHAELMGARMVGNEVNIIAGNVYRTKEHYTRLVLEVPGLTDLEVCPGLPKPNGGFGEIHVICTYRLDGQPYKYSCTAWIRLNEGWSISNVHGKATKYALQRLYAKLTRGTVIPDQDGIGTDRVMDAEFRQVEPREAESDRQAARDAAAAHAGAEGSQDEPLTGDALAAEFLRQIEASPTLLELEAIRPLIKQAATEDRLQRDAMSRTWAAFHARTKVLERGN